MRASTATSFAANSDFQYGDYQGLAVVEGTAYPAWADFRGAGAALGESEVYVGRLRFSEPAGSFSVASRSSGEVFSPTEGGCGKRSRPISS